MKNVLFKRVVPEEYYLGYYDANKQEKEFYVENGIHKTNVLRDNNSFFVTYYSPFLIKLRFNGR